MARQGGGLSSLLGTAEVHWHIIISEYLSLIPRRIRSLPLNCCKCSIVSAKYTRCAQEAEWAYHVFAGLVPLTSSPLCALALEP